MEGVEEEEKDLWAQDLKSEKRYQSQDDLANVGN